MTIIAIGVYDLSNINPQGLPKKIQSAQIKEISVPLFTHNLLTNFESQTLPDYKSHEDVDTIFIKHIEGEHHYFKRITDNLIGAIVSRRDLNATEDCAVPNIFNNIRHICLRQKSVGATLDDIIENPIRFYRDIHVASRLNELHEVKMILLDDVDKLLKRGEKLEELDKKTVILAEDALKFKRQSERLNQGCQC